jgi:Nucleotide-sugar transporter
LFSPSAKVNAYASFYKIGSLATLTFQNVFIILLIRYTKTLPGDVFISSTVVVLMEVFKFFASLLMLLIHHRSFLAWAKELHEEIIRKPVETLKVAVPAFIYTFQNNLTFVAVSNLDAATFQVCSDRLPKARTMSRLIFQELFDFKFFSSFSVGGIADQNSHDGDFFRGHAEKAARLHAMGSTLDSFHW